MGLPYNNVVDLWCSNNELAMEIYGDIRLWDTSNITDMHMVYLAIKLILIVILVIGMFLMFLM